MKIKLKKSLELEFGSLKAGECFLYDCPNLEDEENIYMKIDTIETKDRDDIHNAVRLESGLLQEFRNETLVSPFNCELVEL